MTGERPVYRFGPLERRGLLGPIRSGQAIVIALGLTAAVIALDIDPGATGALSAVVALACAVALAVTPVGGRAIEEWAPVVAVHLLRRVTGRATFRSTAPTRGVRSAQSSDCPAADAAEPPPASREAVEPPPALRDLALIELPYRNRRIGAVSELRGRRLTAVLACRVLSFALLDAETQERRLARWGALLSATAGTPIRRLQWIERTGPSETDELARWLHDARDPGIPLRGEPIVESYLELIEASARVAQEHEILVAIQVDARRLHDRRPEAISEALIEQTEHVARNLQAAEVDVIGALGAPQLAWTLRTAFDPFARGELGRLRAVQPDGAGLPTTSAWPLGLQESWDHVRCDGALHATYWIGGWPRIDVSPMFMDAMLGSSTCLRSIAVTFEPIAPDRSAREVEAAITRDRADTELRRRFGQSETARQRLAHEAALRRETELAAGHAEVRLAGFVTVSGRDERELRRAAQEMLDHAARARLELHRLYGQQAEAFTFTLPLARGLR